MRHIIIHTTLVISMVGLAGSLVFAQANTTTPGQVAAGQQVRQIHKWAE